MCIPDGNSQWAFGLNRLMILAVVTVVVNDQIVMMYGRSAAIKNQQRIAVLVLRNNMFTCGSKLDLQITEFFTGITRAQHTHVMSRFTGALSGSCIRAVFRARANETNLNYVKNAAGGARRWNVWV
jgi:hypothetical protein